MKHPCSDPNKFFSWRIQSYKSKQKWKWRCFCSLVVCQTAEAAVPSSIPVSATMKLMRCRITV